MPRITSPLTNFTSGLISPLIEGQVELKQYYAGGRDVRNLVPLPHGPLKKRGGSAFVKATKNATGAHRLIPFQFNIEQSYVLEFGDQYIRFFADRGQVQLSNQAYEITSPYLESDLAAINYTQSSDVLILVHPNYPPMELLRYGHTSWVLREITFDPKPQTLEQFIEANYTGTIAAVSAGAEKATFTTTTKPAAGWTITFTEGSLTDTAAITKVEIPSGAVYTVHFDTALVNDYTTAAVVAAHPSSLQEANFPTWDSTLGYPSIATFYEQRLVLANSPTYPQALWLSVIGVYDDFSVSADGADDDAIAYTIASDQRNSIEWLLPQATLLMGTTGGEWNVSSGTSTEAITPSNIKAARYTNHGSGSGRPVLVENSALFVQYGGRKVRNIKANILEETYEAEDITILAEHVTSTMVKETAYQNNPDSIYWANCNDGRLIGCTLEKGQNVVAWHDHMLAGSYGTGNAVVESIANVDAEAGDELWMIVKRTINGQTVKYVEYLADHLRSSVPEIDRAYTDSYIYNDFGTPTTVITNLEHLEGETVQPVVDNWVHTPIVVENGELTLSQPGKKIFVGLPYTARYRSMRIQARTEEFSYHMEKRVVRAWISLYESLGVAAGPEDGNIADQLIGAARVMGTAQEYVTKDIEVNIDGQTATDTRLVVESREPLPFTMLSIVYDLEVSAV